MQDKIERLLNIIHHLKEEGMTLGGGNIAGTPEAGDALGQNPSEKKKKKKKKSEYNKYMTGGPGSRRLWIQHLRSKNNK
jgi:hypothetical protein